MGRRRNCHPWAMQVLDAEMMAALDQKEDRSQLLEATLQEKESQLEHLTELQKVRAGALLDLV